MARRVFYSFHYVPDAWRVSQVRNIGTVDDNKPASDNDWESVKKGGDTEIKKWINNQLSGRSCAIIMIGENTANRKWINYEIDKAWADGKGVFGIYIHKLKNSSGNASSKGSNPFDYCTVPGTTAKLSTKIAVYDPPGVDSKAAYE
ncbi:MAG: hypothetical protein EON54_24615, partial [Alcaligenaceae bacterium]